MRTQTQKQTEQHNIFEDNSKTERQTLQVQINNLKARQKGKLIPLFCLLLSGFLFLSVMYGYHQLYGKFDVATTLFALGFSLFLGTIMIVYTKLMFEMRINSIQRKITEIDAIYAQETAEEDIFENSIRMSYKYLDQYYLQTREQAHRGFIVTVGVAILGALLIGGGIVAMFFGATKPSYVTCATGVITEFISVVFFYLYNKTISSMGKYHNKLVLSHSISIALKVADSLPEEEKIIAKKQIVTELIRDINSHLVKIDDDKVDN